ncbi:hypothetical protein SK128_016078, partial [Halocaridina rubra]
GTVMLRKLRSHPSKRIGDVTEQQFIILSRNGDVTEQQLIVLSRNGDVTVTTQEQFILQDEKMTEFVFRDGDVT